MRLVKGRPRGVPSEQRSATFTGMVWADPVLPTTDGITINSVFFAPGARTYWHYHEGGQILQVTAGRGLVCSEGDPAEVLAVGDTVWVPAGERHWHGGGVSCCLEHMATSIGATRWLGPVSDEEYAAAAALLEGDLVQ